MKDISRIKRLLRECKDEYPEDIKQRVLLEKIKYPRMYLNIQDNYRHMWE